MVQIATVFTNFFQVALSVYFTAGSVYFTAFYCWVLRYFNHGKK